MCTWMFSGVREVLMNKLLFDVLLMFAVLDH